MPFIAKEIFDTTSAYRTFQEKDVNRTIAHNSANETLWNNFKESGSMTCKEKVQKTAIRNIIALYNPSGVKGLLTNPMDEDPNKFFVLGTDEVKNTYQVRYNNNFGMNMLDYRIIGFKYHFDGHIRAFQFLYISEDSQVDFCEKQETFYLYITVLLGFLALEVIFILGIGLYKAIKHCTRKAPMPTKIYYIPDAIPQLINFVNDEREQEMKDAIGISFMATVVDLIGGFAFLFDMQHSIEKQDKQGLNTELVWRLMYVL